MKLCIKLYLKQAIKCDRDGRESENLRDVIKTMTSQKNIFVLFII